MSEILRESYDESSVAAGAFPCRGCGKEIRLYENGGEMDARECCGFLYALEITGVDFVIYKQDPRSEEIPASVHGERDDGRPAD